MCAAGRTQPYWLATCSCGYERECVSAEGRRLPELLRHPQHRHQHHAQRDHLLGVAAPIDVGLNVVGLPAQVPEVLDAQVNRPDDPAAPGTRVGRFAGLAWGTIGRESSSKHSIWSSRGKSRERYSVRRGQR
jgi:hypothetical protein